MWSIFIVLCALGKVSSTISEHATKDINDIKILELTHSPFAISASRWGDNHHLHKLQETKEPIEISSQRHSKDNVSNSRSWQEERIVEAYAVQRELTNEWKRNRRLGSKTNNVSTAASTAPLFEGIGTHYAYVYIGTPPQRVTVIVDTGSHHTAFPCSGCSNCGKHTDPYYEPKSSSTNKVLECSQCQGGAHCNAGKKCEFSQSYTEGSSWKAFQMQDLIWVGDLHIESEPVATSGPKLSVPFLFGCQYSETGLFRTQKADGIMGLSINGLTLVPTLARHNLIPFKTFSLCFSRTGGMMMIGGADTSSLVDSLSFIPLSKKSSWFTIHLYDIRIQSGKQSGSDGSIGVKDSVFNSGKGVIVDSGTTDTYLPRALANQFKSAFKKATKRDYANTRVTLNEKEFASYPNIVFVFKDQDGNEVAVEVKPDAYMEKQGSDRYVPRIYLTEGSGAVLGANFMQDQLVVFDEQNNRVGIGRANCEYQEFIRDKLNNTEHREPK